MLGNKEIIAKNIRRYLNENNMTQSELSKICDVGQSTVSGWLNAQIYPRIDKIEIMARLWGISKADLVEEASSNYVTSDEMQLIYEYRNCDLDTQKMIKRLLAYSEHMKKVIE